MSFRINKRIKRLGNKILAIFISYTFIFNLVIPPSISYTQVIPQTMTNLPAPGVMVPLNVDFAPAMVKGITIYSENPLQFDFIVDTGQTKLKGQKLREESIKLIKYFLASLTVPEKDMWVNLSPYEKDRIIPEKFGTTEMGRDLLTQDYILKQLMASITYPEKGLGKRFWDRVYKRTYEEYGTTDIPLNTFNKVWIVPEKAVVYENGGSAFVVDSHLKVMLEEDYLALQSNLEEGEEQIKEVKAISKVSSGVVREVLIPEIEREVNTGKSFANLRQIYNSMILATWYKVSLKESLLGRVYVDKKKTRGIAVKDKGSKEKIYEQYLKAFKAGVYEYVKEEYDDLEQEVITRKYFSGGITASSKVFGQLRELMVRVRDEGLLASEEGKMRDRVVRGLQPAHHDSTIFSITMEAVDVGPNAEEEAVNTAMSKTADALVANDNAMLLRSEAIKLLDLEDRTKHSKGYENVLMLGMEESEFQELSPVFATALERVEYGKGEFYSNGTRFGETIERFVEHLDGMRYDEFGQDRKMLEREGNRILEEKKEQFLKRPKSSRVKEALFSVTVHEFHYGAHSVRTATREVAIEYKEPQLSRVNSKEEILEAIGAYASRERISLKEALASTLIIVGESTFSGLHALADLREYGTLYDGLRPDIKPTDRFEFIEEFNKKNILKIEKRQIRAIAKESLRLKGKEDETTGSELGQDSLIHLLDEMGTVKLDMKTGEFAGRNGVTFSQRANKESFWTETIELGHGNKATLQLDPRKWRRSPAVGSHLSRQYLSVLEIKLRKFLTQPTHNRIMLIELREIFEVEKLKEQDSRLQKLMDILTESEKMKELLRIPVEAAIAYGQAIEDLEVELREARKKSNSGITSTVNAVRELEVKLLERKEYLQEARALKELICRIAMYSERQVREDARKEKSKDSEIIETDISSTQDNAVLTKGGIDLDPVLLDFQIKRDSDGVPLSLPQQPIDDMNIEGFFPVIINVSPNHNLPLILGFSGQNEEPMQLGYNRSLGPLEERERFKIQTFPDTNFFN